MSRIGKKPIIIPQGVDVKCEENGLVTVKGPKGELSFQTHPLVKIEKKENEILVSVAKENDKEQRSLWGTNQKIIDNMVVGVTEGYEKKLEINGVGYRAQLAGKKLTLNVGFSHPVDFEAPEGVKLEVEKNLITVTGIDKQLVGETAAQIRKIKKPEPYKGKGIKYVDEVIIRKAGKQAKTGA